MLEPKEIRLGNDIRVIWSIFHKDVPYSLVGKDLVLELRQGVNTIEVKDFEVEDNKISFSFYGKDQKNYGAYYLILKENDGEMGMRTVNSCNAFRLVSNSCNIGGEAQGCSHVQIETIELSGSLEGGGLGLSAYEVAVKNGFVGTEQEWIASLKGEKGDKGKQGVGVQSISGNIDGTWTITYTDGSSNIISNEAYVALLEKVNGKVDKENGKGLSTEDFTTELKSKLLELKNYDDGAIRQQLNRKVDIVEGKQLSTEDFTTEEKQKLATLENFDPSGLNLAISKKVDKVVGKGLSTEDFTTLLKTKLEGLENYDDTQIQADLTKLTNSFNELVQGDPSAAIESFNEIVAFLKNVEDTETLEGIIAGINRSIATKQDILASGTNIKTVNGESVLGKGNIVTPRYDDTSVKNRLDNVEAKDMAQDASINKLDGEVKAINSTLGIIDKGLKDLVGE